MDKAQRAMNGHGFLLPDKPLNSLDEYLSVGGGQGLKKALSMPREKILAEVKKSGLRGRGGAGFPTGIKWASIASDPCATKYVICNATEGEPGTFKDRLLMRRNPYQLIEGVAIAAHTMGAKKAFIAMKASFEKAAEAVERALGEMAARDCLGPAPIELVYGPEDYLLGEEKALLEVVEGRDPLPREADYPPYILGVFAGYPSCLPGRTNPTLVNNCETMSNIPHIIRDGADWFRSMGSADTPGTMVLTVSGDVQKQGVYELPLGIPLRVLIEQYAGGCHPGRKVKGIFSGVASGGIFPQHLDTPLEFGALRDIGAGLGSGGFIVYDDSACMVQVAYTLSRFLWIESCGQCRSCKENTQRATEHLKRLIDGQGDAIDADIVLHASANAPRANRCYLPTEHSLLIPSIVNGFEEEFAQHFKRGCRNCREAVLPKMHDYDEKTMEFSYTHGRETP